MEAVGSVASILTLVGTALQSSKVIYQVANNFKHLHLALDNIATVTEQLSATLPRLRSLCDSKVAQQNDFQDVDDTFCAELETLLVVCTEDLHGVERDLEVLRHKASQSRLGRTSAALKLFHTADKFGRACARIQLYTQKICVLMSRATIIDISINHIASTKQAQDNTISVQQHVSDELNKIHERIVNGHEMTTTKLDTIIAEVQSHKLRHTEMTTTQSQQTHQVLAHIDSLAAQQVRDREHLTASNLEQHGELLSSLMRIVEDTEATRRSQHGNQTTLSELATRIQDLHLRLDSFQDAAKPSSHEAAHSTSNLPLTAAEQKDQHSQAEKSRQTEQINQLMTRVMMAARSREQKDPFGPSQASLLKDLMRLIARISASIKLDADKAPEILDGIDRIEKTFTLTQTLAEPLIEYEAGLSSSNKDDSSHPDLGQLVPYPFSRKRKAVVSTTRPAKMQRQADTVSRVTSSDFTDCLKDEPRFTLRNRKTRKVFKMLSGVQAVENYRNSLQSMEANLVHPNPTSLTFVSDCGRVDLLLVARPVCKILSEEEGIEEEIYASVVLTPSATSRSFNQVILTCLQKVGFDGRHHVQPIRFTTRATKITVQNRDLFRTAMFGSPDTMLRLFEAGKASPMDQDQHGRSLLSYALRRRNHEMIEFLVSYGLDLDAFEPDLFETEPEAKYQPLLQQYPAFYGDRYENKHESMTQTLATAIKLGVDLCYAYQEGSYGNIMLRMIQGAPASLLKLALDCGDPEVTVQRFGNHDLSPILLVTQALAYTSWELPDKFALLLSRGADCNVRDVVGRTCLHLAFHRSNSKGTRFVCDEHGSVSTQALDGDLKDILMLLITSGADVVARDHDGISVSDMAVLSGYWDEWASSLHECGLDPDLIAKCERDTMTSQAYSSCIEKELRTQHFGSHSTLGFEDYLKIREKRRYYDPVDTDIKRYSDGKWLWKPRNLCLYRIPGYGLDDDEDEYGIKVSEECRCEDCSLSGDQQIFFDPKLSLREYSPSESEEGSYHWCTAEVDEEISDIEERDDSDTESYKQKQE